MHREEACCDVSGSPAIKAGESHHPVYICGYDSLSETGGPALKPQRAMAVWRSLTPLDYSQTMTAGELTALHLHTLSKSDGWYSLIQLGGKGIIMSQGKGQLYAIFCASAAVEPGCLQKGRCKLRFQASRKENAQTARRLPSNLRAYCG